MNLDVEYKSTLTNVGINFIAIPKLELTRFLILLRQNESMKEVEPKVVGQLPNWIFYSFNKFTVILMNKLAKSLLFTKMLTTKLKCY
jgi:hypothetical protein